VVGSDGVVIACFASIAPRRHQLVRAVESILPQVDRVFIYLNGWSEPWPGLWPYADKIDWTFSRVSGWRGSEAKFWWSDAAKLRQLELEDVDAYLCCDDDILYPDDYVTRMREAMARHPGDMIGVHGAQIREPVTNYHQCLELRAGFQQPLHRDTQVHLLGTGTVAFEPALWRGLLGLETFYVPNMADLWLALAVRQAGRKLWAVARPAKWLRALPTQGYSVSAAKSQGRDLAETELVQMHCPWPSLGETDA
jgi:hypothetical protein